MVEMPNRAEFFLPARRAKSARGLSRKKFGDELFGSWVYCNPLKLHKTVKGIFGKAWRKRAEIWKSLQKKLGEPPLFRHFSAFPSARYANAALRGREGKFSSSQTLDNSRNAEGISFRSLVPRASAESGGRSTPGARRTARTPFHRCATRVKNPFPLAGEGGPIARRKTGVLRMPYGAG
jgi:hypothetical protein